MELQDALETEKFTLSSLTAAINNIEQPPMRLAELGIFEERGIRTTSIEIEFKDGEIIIVPEKERGADGTHTEDRERKLFTFKAVHLPLEASIYADDVQNLRAFGSESELEQLDELIDEKLEDHKLSIDATIEYQRIGALMGKVLGAKGNVLYDLFKVFGISSTANKHEITFGTGLRQQLRDVKRQSKKNQKGIKGKRYRGLCSASFMDDLLEDPDFIASFERKEDGQPLREDMREGVYWQGVWWEEYDDEVDNKKLIPDGEAIVFPEDKPKLLLTRFAPANYKDTVNTTGLPYYTNSEPKRMNKGVDLESQSNPINVCTNPLAVRRLVKKAA